MHNVGCSCASARWNFARNSVSWVGTTEHACTTLAPPYCMHAAPATAGSNAAVVLPSSHALLQCLVRVCEADECDWLSHNPYPSVMLCSVKAQQRRHLQASTVSKLQLPLRMHIQSLSLLTSTERSCAHMGRNKQRQTHLQTMPQLRCRQTFWHWLEVGNNTGSLAG